jgi:hypothetical protein
MSKFFAKGKTVTDKEKILFLQRAFGNKIITIDNTTYIIHDRRYVFNREGELTFIS